MLDALWHNPFRSPSWAWRRANAIHTGSQPGLTMKRDGKPGMKRVRPLMRYLRGWQKCHNDIQKAELAAHEPKLFWAHSVFMADDAPVKWLIEARLLARETDNEIAARLGCDPSIVACYHDTFFDVREKINYRDYIINSVFGEACYRGLSERRHDLLWKLFGYYGGPHVLDTVSSRLGGSVWCNSPEQASKFLQDTAINAMKQKAAIAALTVPINSETHIDLIESFVKYVEIERNTESQGQARDQIVDNIQATLEALPFAAYKGAASLKGTLEQYDNTSVELRTDELLAASLGAQLPYADMLTTMCFPPPPALTVELVEKADKDVPNEEHQGSRSTAHAGNRRRRLKG